MLLVISAPGEGETLDEIDELFALPLDEFTAARNALAKRLKQDGDAEAAEAVRTLSKPSVAAWAVNQLARRDPETVRSLLNVAARLRSAQERSLKGERAADELRAAQAEERGHPEADARRGVGAARGRASGQWNDPGTRVVAAAFRGGR
jgi:hypothetical protein